MGIRFKNRLELFLLFGEKEFPFAPVNSLDFLHMCSSTRLAIPMIHLRVRDSAHWMSKNQVLADGERITVIINSGNEQERYVFRLNSFKELMEATGPVYEIDGYYDCPIWWLSSGSNLINGTSSDVIKKLAERCNIQRTFVTATADSQVWVQKNLKYHEFASFISQHGYVNEQSCMQLGFNLDGSLGYKNIVASEESALSYVTAEFRTGSYIATDFKIKNNSGVLNAISGYADDTISASVLTQNITRFETVPITKLTERLMVNAGIYNDVAKSRVMFAPIDGGNVHQNYIKAKYQNQRNASTYAFSLEIVSPQKSNLRLLDFISFTSKQQERSQDRSYSGKYLVTGRVIYVQGINYFEKIEAVRHGLNAPVESQK